MYTIDQAMQDFMLDNERKNLSPETMRYYRENLSRFFKWLSRQKVAKVSKITKETIDEYLLYLLRTVHNRISVNTYMRAVRRFVNYLADRHAIKPYKIKLFQDEIRIKETFDTPEVMQMLDAVDPQDDTSIIMMLLLAVGIRSRSLCELNVRDINFSDNSIIIRRTKNRKPLILPISPSICLVIKEYIAIYGRHDVLFLSSRGGKFNRDSLRKKINKRLNELGIPNTKRGVHIFRHTFGKIMSMNSCPTAVLQKWFGHSDIRTTQKYIDLYGNELKNTMNMLPTSGYQYCK